MTTRRQSSRLRKLEEPEEEAEPDVANDFDGEEEEEEELVKAEKNGRGRKRPVIEEEYPDDEGDYSDSRNNKESSKIKVEAGKAGSIPKKVRKTNPQEAKTTDPSQPSRLVQSAAPAALPAPVVASSTSVSDVAKSSPRKKAGIAAAESQLQKVVLPTTTTTTPSSSSAQTGTLPSAVLSTSSTRNQAATTATTAAANTNTKTSTTTTTAVTKEQGIWEKMESMCAAAVSSEDLRGRFELGSSTNSNVNGSSSNVDLSGTFLRHDPYDFLEFNVAGEVVVEHKHPMFPEDFSRAGMKEHPLSWWGVLDPVQGEGKYRSVPPPQHMVDSRIHGQAPPPGQLQVPVPQQQQQHSQLQQQQQPPWPTHGQDRGGRPTENGGSMARGGRQGPDAPRWNRHGPPMEQGPPWMGPGGGPGMRMPPNGDAFRGGGAGSPAMLPNGGRGGGGAGGPGPGRGRPHAPHSRQHGRR